MSRLLLLVLCLLLLSVGDFSGGSSPHKTFAKVSIIQQTYTIPEIGIPDFDTLDPALAHDTASISAIQMVFTGLVQLNDQLQIRPQLAQSWHLADDGLTWTFHLTPHLKFSDGTPLTSADVAYSLDRALQPATQSTVAPLYLSLIKDSDQLLAGQVKTLIGDSLMTPDANTLIIVTNKPAPYFLSMLTYTCSYVVEKSLVSKYGAHFSEHLSEGGGAGPFQVAQYTHRIGIEFVPNPNYYNAKPQLQHVYFTFYPSVEDAYTDYQQHKLDMTEVPTSTLSKDRTHKDFFQIPQLWINYYSMNYLSKPFDNIKIRQAFALAIDKRTIANDVWHNTVVPTNHIVPQGMDGYNAKLTRPDGTQSLTANPQRAEELLKEGMQEEGWSSLSQIPTITLTYAAGVSSIDQEVTALVRMWQQVLHITVTLDAVQYDILLDKVTASTNNAHGLQFWGLAWVGEYPDPHDWLTLQFDKDAVYNNMNYGQNLSADARQQVLAQQQMEYADGNLPQSARIQQYQQSEQQLVNDVAWLPMEQVTANFLRSPSIVGITNNAQSIIPPNDWANIYRVQ